MILSVPAAARVLFIGDSITDAGRDRANGDDLGHGYALMAAAWFTATNPGHGVTFVNRGIGGDRVRDLRARWDTDCVALRPDVVSVMIGINDTWRRYDNADPTTHSDYERDYRDILDRVVATGPVKLLLIEPFLLPMDDYQRTWREDLDPRIEMVRTLAADYGATLVPADGVFAEAGVAHGPSVWTTDGVHLTPAGDALLAQAWLRAVTPAS